jgi:signal peptide peptidase SppA
MRYARILTAVAGTPWTIHPAKGRAIMDFLAYAAAGGKRSPEEVAAIIGRPIVADGDASADRPEHATRPFAVAKRQGGSGDSVEIAILGLKGVISPRLSDEMDISGPGGTSAEGFARRLNAAVEDPRIAGIIVDVDSPGGNVFGVPEAADAMFAARGSKPIVAVANPFTASGALWIASAADEVVVTPSGEIGSLGVYAYHEDLSKALETIGVSPTLVKADISPNKAETHPAFPLTEDAIGDIKASVDRYGEMFVASMARSRGVSVDHVTSKFGGGRMLGADDAVAVGMADRIATLDDEIARMADLISKPKEAASASVASRRRRMAVI